ncbi:Bromodomain-containing protein [Thalictrum thalictroides]|uniref:Bromodomain-containing protein n=1 Tax=Thalictrum thalictroides TaxID=46969 RepID=A0A7J6WXG0_THATH|nr:Bromodomain-containing protein [Thalictrum thalictroides]
MTGYGQRRRSARLSALGDTMKAQQVTSEEFEAFLESDEIQQEQVVGSLPRPESDTETTKVGKKKRKLRPVDDVLGNNSNGVLAQEVDAEQGRKNTKHESHSNNGKLSAEPLASQIPEKRLLKLVIDILQKKDSHEIFAEPVDPTEVEGYYEVIKEPMDFFTMKEKVQQGTYTSLEQFEHDIFVIFDNAMLFNAENTIFYRQARSIHGLAMKVIHTLRNDPENFELEFSATRKRSGRKPKCEAKNSNPTVQTEVSTGARTNRITPAFDSNEGRRYNISGAGEGARCTYRPWTSFLNENESLVSDLSDYSKPLLLVSLSYYCVIIISLEIGRVSYFGVPQANKGGLGYCESLMRFVEGLGPTAQMVAKRKLQQNQVLPTNHQIPASSGQGRLTPQNSTEIVPTIQNAFYRSSNPSTVAHFGDGLHICDTYRSNMDRQRESFKLPVNRDLNLPANDGMMESDSYLAMMVDACQSKTKAWPDELASRARLHELDAIFPRKNSNSGSSLFPFQAMRALNLSQPPSSSIHGLESHSQGMVEQRQSYDYDMSLAQQISSSVLPSLRVAPSMHGGFQVSRPSSASSISPQAGLVMEGRRQASLVLPSGVEYQIGTPSESNYVVSSSQTVPFLERNQPSSLMRTQHSLPEQNQGLAELGRLSNRVNSSLELRSSSYPLNGGDQNMATPSWNCGLIAQPNANPDQNKCSHHSPIWNHPSMQCLNSSFLYGDKQVTNAPVLPPTSSYGIIKPVQPSSHKLLDSQYGDAPQVINAPAMPSYGIVDSVQPNSLLEWNQPKIWGGQAASSNGIYLHPYDNGMKKLWEQNGLAQPEPLRLGPSGSDATSMQIYARDTMQNQQAEPNTNLALLHNQQSDVALKLSLSEQIYRTQS